MSENALSQIRTLCAASSLYWFNTSEARFYVKRNETTRNETRRDIPKGPQRVTHTPTVYCTKNKKQFSPVRAEVRPLRYVVQHIARPSHPAVVLLDQWILSKPPRRIRTTNPFVTKIIMAYVLIGCSRVHHSVIYAPHARFLERQAVATTLFLTNGSSAGH